MRPQDLWLATPWALLGLIPIALLALHLGWRRHRRLEPTLRFPSSDFVKDLPRSIFVKLRWLPDALRVAALTTIVLALARPQLVAPPEPEEARGIDIVLAVDTSCSMMAADFQPKDRMEVAKKSIGEFILRRHSDRIGLVVFAGEAASWVPLTLDYSWLGEMLTEVEVGMLEDGTAIGNAIGTSLNRLRESGAESKVVVLLTDGDSNKGTISPLEAARFAKELGVRIYTILIGREGPVPFPAGKDLFGRIVYRNQNVPTNPKLLEKIAATTGGQAYLATDKQELDERLDEVLDSLEKSRLESSLNNVAYAELFPHTVLLALGLLALELLFSATRWRKFP